MARDGDARFGSMSFFAAQTDFTEAGELMLFINESQLSFLEDMMWEQGFLDTKQMAGAFQMLRSNDLVWSRPVRDYLMGERQPMTDLMAWNADATRMPYRMHTEYLRHLFLDNDLAEGRYPRRRRAGRADRHPRADLRRRHRDRSRRAVALGVQVPPADAADVTFLLTSGGHNAGHRLGAGPSASSLSRRQQARPAITTWIRTPGWPRRRVKEGSWWPEWVGVARRALGRAGRPAGDGERREGLPAAGRRAGDVRPAGVIGPPGDALGGGCRQAFSGDRKCGPLIRSCPR